LQNIPVFGDDARELARGCDTAKLYAVKHNPFPYVAEIQDSPAEFAKQVPIEQLFGDLGAKTVPAFSYIVPISAATCTVSGTFSPRARCQ